MWWSKIHSACSDSLYIDEIISYYDLSGISSKSDSQILKEKIKLNYELGLNLFQAVISYFITKIVKLKNVL